MGCPSIIDLFLLFPDHFAKFLRMKPVMFFYNFQGNSEGLDIVDSQMDGTIYSNVLKNIKKD